MFLHTFAETEKKHPKNLIAVFSEILTIDSHIIDVHFFFYKNKLYKKARLKLGKKVRAN